MDNKNKNPYNSEKISLTQEFQRAFGSSTKFLDKTSIIEHPDTTGLHTQTYSFTSDSLKRDFYENSENC